jgi:hypothetical protein
VAVVAAMVLMPSPASASIADKRNDFTGDGISDLVAVNAGTGCLWRWNGASNGGVGAGAQLGCGWNPYLGSLASPGDLNGDGHGDIVAINQDIGCLFRWYGDGSGGFGAGAQVGCGWGDFLATLVGAGDLNNDGAGDLLAVNQATGCMFRWFGSGAGGFGLAAQLGCGWNPYVGTVTGAGDINSDGNADIVGIDSVSDCLFRWFGDGSGGFGTGTQVGCGWGPFSGGGAVSGLGALNGDSLGDLVAINIETGCLFRWLGAGGGNYGVGGQLGCGWSPYFLST